MKRTIIAGALIGAVVVGGAAASVAASGATASGTAYGDAASVTAPEATASVTAPEATASVTAPEATASVAASETAATSGIDASGTASEAADAGLNAQDRLFLHSAHQGNLAEITAARIAQEKSTTRSVRDLATRWLTDHTALDLRLSQAAVALDVVLPARQNASQDAVEAQYRAAAREDFDELWVSTQVTAHHQATALVAAELRGGASAAVKTLAREAGPVIDAHLRLLSTAALSAGVVIPAEGNAPQPGEVRTAAPSSAPSPAWQVTESPGTPGWTRPSPEMSGGTRSPIPIPGGPGPSITVGSS